MVTETIFETFPGIVETDDEAWTYDMLRLLPGDVVPMDRFGVTTLGPALPLDFTLGALLDGRLRIRSSIAVTMKREADDFIAEAEELNEFGFGKSYSEAIEDLQRAIAELYFTLQAEGERLGPDLSAVWSTLKHKIQQIP